MTERTIQIAERRAKAYDLVGDTCADCGTSENLTMDHRDNDREDRAHLPAELIKGDWDRFVLEVPKLQTLCRSCHAKKTARDLGRGPSPHGTLARYANQKCRCTDCRYANASYSRIIRNRKA